jgi:hypothetical protein
VGEQAEHLDLAPDEIENVCILLFIDDFDCNFLSTSSMARSLDDRVGASAKKKKGPEASDWAAEVRIQVGSSSTNKKKNNKQKIPAWPLRSIFSKQNQWKIL